MRGKLRKNKDNKKRSKHQQIGENSNTQNKDNNKQANKTKN